MSSLHQPKVGIVTSPDSNVLHPMAPTPTPFVSIFLCATARLAARSTRALLARPSQLRHFLSFLHRDPYHMRVRLVLFSPRTSRRNRVRFLPDPRRGSYRKRVRLMLPLRSRGGRHRVRFVRFLRRGSHRNRVRLLMPSHDAASVVRHASPAFDQLPPRIFISSRQVRPPTQSTHARPTIPYPFPEERGAELGGVAVGSHNYWFGCVFMAGDIFCWE
jgi:hypothetical protein